MAITVWKKSSRSTNNGCCVEVANFGDHVAMRDSKDRDGGHLQLSLVAWSAFLAAIKDTYDYTR